GRSVDPGHKEKRGGRSESNSETPPYEFEFPPTIYDARMQPSDSSLILGDRDRMAHSPWDRLDADPVMVPTC
ncbi:MAG: hypothetical protein ACQESR_23025, partial [Planctomycetota bacterium]